MFADIQFIFRWWLVIFEIGLVSLPVSYFLFPRLTGLSYILAKGVGILLVSYICWFVVSVDLLPFSSATSWLIFSSFSVFQVFLFLLNLPRVSKFIRLYWQVFVVQEILFLVALVVWSLVRAYQPDIRGLEKFMDLGFVNAILNSTSLPPQDMWFSGQPINYYYFGHFITALLTRLSGIPSYVTYNLMIATLFSLTFSFSFVFAKGLFNLPKISGMQHLLRVPFILLTPFLVSLSGNPHIYYWLWKNSFNFSSYWYPDATRFIVQQFGASDNTIHEFPIYSFVVADLHGHLLNLPFVLLFLILLLYVFLDQKISLLRGGFLSFLLACFVMISTWDVPIYFLLLSGTFFLVSFAKTNLFISSVLRTITFSGGVFAGSLILASPFLGRFKNISGGIKIAEFHSPLWMLGVLWGLFFSLTFIFLIWLFRKYKSIKGFVGTPDVLILWFVLVGWLLVIVPEVIYIKDIYIHEYQRANTMFKLTYQAFVIFSLTSFYIVWRVFSWEKGTAVLRKSLKTFYLGFFTLVLTGQVVYSYFAVRSYYGLVDYRGINGISWIKDYYPGEYEAISWLRHHKAEVKVALQAVGDSYTDFGVISAYTGIPTIQGWLVHEWLWRGSFDEPGKRSDDVEKIYVSKDLENVYSLLKKYGVSHVVVGALERDKYPLFAESKFKSLGKLVFSSSGTQIYEINLD